TALCWRKLARLDGPSPSSPAASRTSRDRHRAGSMFRRPRRFGPSERRTAARAKGETDGRPQRTPKSDWAGVQFAWRVPCISDRVVQMAAVLIIGPIFEADLLPQQYGFRPRLDAKMALRRVYWHVTQHGRREVVDADLRDYF